MKWIAHFPKWAIHLTATSRVLKSLTSTVGFRGWVAVCGSGNEMDSPPKLLAFMTLLALNALRIGEALSRDIDDLTYDFGHLVLELACKGGKRSTEALAPATARALEAYIGKRTSGPIFLDRKGGRTTEPTPGA